MGVVKLKDNDVYNINESYWLADTLQDLNGLAEKQVGDIGELTNGTTYRYTSTGWVKRNTGGGGGSDLPDVTIEDDGKVLGVVNGAWDKMEVSEEERVVFTYNDPNVTYQEVFDAFDAGKTVLVTHNYKYFGITLVTAQAIVFSRASGTTIETFALTNADQWEDISTVNVASLSSPAFTGTPTAPTAAAGTNTTQIATTAFVQTAVAGAGGGIGRAGNPHRLDKHPERRKSP